MTPTVEHLLDNYRSRWNWRGDIRIWIFEGDKLLHLEDHNTIVDTGANMLRDTLRGTVTDARIRYMAWGSSPLLGVDTMTQLNNEQGRKAVTSQTPGARGVLTTVTVLGTSDANVQIEELGWFATATATGTANSGVLVGRYLWSHLKTSAQTVQVDRRDDLGTIHYV